MLALLAAQVAGAEPCLQPCSDVACEVRVADCLLASGRSRAAAVRLPFVRRSTRSMCSRSTSAMGRSAAASSFSPGGRIGALALRVDSRKC